jgi:hypothetical protein
MISGFHLNPGDSYVLTSIPQQKPSEYNQKYDFVNYAPNL